MMAELKLVEVTAFPFAVPLVNPFRIATMECRAAEGVWARVRTAGGLVGWGEATPLASINGETQGTVIEALKMYTRVGGADWISRRAEAMQTCRRALPGHGAALSALEMAIWDVLAQQAGLPLWALLGGDGQPRPTDATIGIVEPEVAAERAQSILDRGFRHIKIKLGDSPAADMARVEAVAAVAEDHEEIVALRVDANQAYKRDTAIEVLNGCVDYGVEFCEQPVARFDHAGLAFCHEFGGTPVMADESCFGPEDVVALARVNACGLVNVKVSKAGGLERSLDTARAARAAHMECMMGGMVETRLGVTAALHVAMSDPAFRWFDLDAAMGHAEDPILCGVEYRDGHAVAPDHLGLGASPDPAYLNRLSAIDLSLV